MEEKRKYIWKYIVVLVPEIRHIMTYCLSVVNTESELGHHYSNAAIDIKREVKEHVFQISKLGSG